MAEGSLMIHLTNQHGRVAETRRKWRTLSAGARPQNSRMNFPVKVGPQSFLVERCPGQVVTKTAMQVHFLHRHVLATMVILE